MVTVTVDRIEGDIAVLEVNDVLVDWPLRALPATIREGQRLVVRFTSPDGTSPSSSDDASVTPSPDVDRTHIEL
jgi:hypothetical protein